MSARAWGWNLRTGAGPLNVEGQMRRAKKVDLAEARALYDRCGPMVLRFCELFLGEKSVAEQVTAESFLGFLRGGGRAETNSVPVVLLRTAFLAVSQSRTKTGEPKEPLRAAIVHLDVLPRAVFILHGVLSVQTPWVGAILGMSADEARELWTKALVEIRPRLPQDFFKEQGR